MTLSELNEGLKKFKFKHLIIPYLIALTACILFYGYTDLGTGRKELIRIGAYCFLTGTFSGTIYCMRAYYIHAGHNWKDGWTGWYFLRPIVSGMVGLSSFLFIKTGLLVYAKPSFPVSGSDNIALYLVAAYIAGYSVENFFQRVEKAAKKEEQDQAAGAHK